MHIFSTPEFPKNISVLFRNLAISVSCLALVGCSVPQIDVNRIVKATPIAIPSATPTPVSAESPTPTHTSVKPVEVESPNMTLGAILEDLLKRETLPVQEYENEKLVPIELVKYTEVDKLKKDALLFPKHVDLILYSFNHMPSSAYGELYGIGDDGTLIVMGEGGLGYGSEYLVGIDFDKYLKSCEGVMIDTGGRQYLIVLGGKNNQATTQILINPHTDTEDIYARAYLVFPLGDRGEN